MSTRDIAVETDELGDLIEAKLMLIAGIIDRRGFLERRYDIFGGEVPRKRVVSLEGSDANRDLEADLRFIRGQIDRSLELLETLRVRATVIEPEPKG